MIEVILDHEADLNLIEMILLGYMVLVGEQGKDWVNWITDPRMELRRN